MEKNFDKSYLEHDCYWGLKPHESIIELSKLLEKKGNVLDLGCGEGRDTLFLAKKGFSVTAIDKSKSGIEKIKKLSKKFGVNVKTIVEDIRNINIIEKYSGIICMATLHFLELEEIKNLVNKMKTMTKPGGYNVITVFTKENPFKKFAHLFAKEELKEFYSDWKIIKYEDILTPLETHGESKPHRHGKVILIAKKYL